MTRRWHSGVLCVLICASAHPVSRAEKPRVRSHTQWVRQFFVDAKEKRLLSLGGNDPENVMRSWSLQRNEAEKLPGKLRKAWSYAESGDGKKSAYCLHEGESWTVYFTDASWDKPARVIEIPTQNVVFPPSLFFDSRTKKLVSVSWREALDAASEVHQWNWEKKGVPEHQTLAPGIGFLPRFLPQISSLALVSNDRNSIVIWDLAKAAKSYLFEAPGGGEISLVEPFRSQARLIIGFSDGRLYLWDLMQNRQLCQASNSPLIAAAFTADESGAFLGDGEGGLHYFDFAKGRATSNLHKESLPISCLALLPKSKRLAIGCGIPDREVIGRIVILRNDDTRKVDAVFQNDQAVLVDMK